MKYTNYIMNESTNFGSVGVLAIPAAVMGMPILVGFLGGAIIMDSGRYVKLRYLLRQRELRQEAYIKCVLRSLDRAETRENIEMLKAL